MSPAQLAELLVGIAKAQAAAFEAVTATYERGIVVSQARQAADRNLHALKGSRGKTTLETLPAKILQAALSPSSHAGKNIQEDTIAELERLLKEKA